MSDKLAYRHPAKASSLDIGLSQTILTLTASSEDSILTRAQTRFLFSNQRKALPETAMLFFDLFNSQQSTINPPDSQTLSSLAFITLKEMISTAVFRHSLYPDEHNQIRFSADSRIKLGDIGSSPLGIRPASLRSPILNRLRLGTIQLRTGTPREPDELTLPFQTCPACRTILPPDLSCPKHPNVQAGPVRQIVISNRIQRLIWLAVKMTAFPGPMPPHQHHPLSTLLLEPRLLNNDMPLFLTILLWRKPRLPFRELIVWPKLPTSGASGQAVPKPRVSRENLAMLWPGWQGSNRPPNGRLRFVDRFEKTWERLRHLPPPVTTSPDRKHYGTSNARQVDRWLLHSLNLAVASFLRSEEQRRSFLSFEYIARFMRHKLINGYLIWRRTDWDAEALEILSTVRGTLESLFVPYGLCSMTTKPSALAPLTLYRRDWIFSREYKLVETARRIQHAILSLEGEIRGLGLRYQGPVILSRPKLREKPIDLLDILKRLSPSTEIEVSLDNNRSDRSGLLTQSESWRITMSLHDETFRQTLLQRYRDRLLREQGRYESFRALYTAHKNSPDTSHNHLRTMRSKLLKLKKRQMITLMRTHELR